MKSPRLHRFLLWLWRAPFPDWLRWLFLWSIYPKYMATVAAVVLNRQGETLLFHHTYRREHPWGLPGGWLERNEEPAAAVQREIEEESGLCVRVLRPLWVGRETRRARLDIVFVAEVVGGSFRPSAEVDQAAYFSLEALPPLTRRARRLIQMALAGPQEAALRLNIDLAACVDTSTDDEGLV